MATEHPVGFGVAFILKQDYLENYFVYSFSMIQTASEFYILAEYFPIVTNKGNDNFRDTLLTMFRRGSGSACRHIRHTGGGSRYQIRLPSQSRHRSGNTKHVTGEGGW